MLRVMSRKNKSGYLYFCDSLPSDLVTIPAARQLLDDSRQQQLPAVVSCQTRPPFPVTAARTQTIVELCRVMSVQDSLKTRHERNVSF